MTRSAVSILIVAALSGCGPNKAEGPTPSSSTAAQQAAQEQHAAAEAETVDGCAERFLKRTEWPAGRNARTSVAYLFDAGAAAPELLREGIEGLKLNEISASGGADADALAWDRASQLLANDERPRLVYFAQSRPMLLYKPEHSFFPDEAQAHLRSMCGLASRGLRLRSFSLNFGGREG